MNHIWIDLRNAWRLMLRNTSVTLIILILLAVGTGGVMAVINPIYSLVLANPPFPQSDSLVVIGGDIPLFNSRSYSFERKDALDHLFSNITTYAPSPATTVIISDTGRYKEILAVEVNANFFETLGIQLLYGYDFKHDEAGRVIIVSNRFWRDELGGKDDIIGVSLMVRGFPATLVGIMPETFNFPIGTDIWLYPGKSLLTSSRDFNFLGRLRPEITMEQAARELEAIEFESDPFIIGKDGPVLQPLKTVYYIEQQNLLWMLGVASVLFLLLVCFGVMGIFITGGTRRKSEMTMRLILGASRRNLVFQLLCETLPLVIVGTLAGMWLSEIVSTWLYVQFPKLQGGEVVVSVKMTFWVALVVITSIIGGLIPALYTSNINLNTSLKSGAASRQRFISLRELLVGVQLGLTLALLIGSGLLLRGVMHSANFPVGWSPKTIISAGVMAPLELSLGRLERATRRAAFYQEFQHQLETMPEVVATGVLTPVPFSDEAAFASLRSLTFSKTRDADRSPELENSNLIVQNAIQGYASPEAFKMLEIPLFAGRFFTPADVAYEFNRQTRSTRTGPVAGGVAIINQSLAKQLWPRESAIGKIIYDQFLDSHEIVGVVQDFHQVTDRKFIPTMYFPIGAGDETGQKFLVELRSDKSTNDFVQRLSALNTGSGHIDTQPLEEIVSESTANIRILLQLLGWFALLGIVIAGSGVYATATLMAIFRNKETGIRMAMGAQTRDILWLALWRGVRTLLIGLPLGLFLAWILSRILSSFAFQLNPNDPLAWIVSCVTMLTITIIAALVPALRATRVNPLDALRNE